jgi:fatty acid-binding protein DegV
MSTQSPLPQNDPMLIAFQKLKKTQGYKNAVKWIIKAENESQADGELWFAFAAGHRAAAGKAKQEIAEEIENHSYLAGTHEMCVWIDGLTKRLREEGK